MKSLIYMVILVLTSQVYAASSSTALELIQVPQKFKTCKVDSDCVLTNTLCGCCHLTTINKNHVDPYLELEKQCKKTPPPCDCPEPNALSKCIKQICTLI